MSNTAVNNSATTTKKTNSTCSTKKKSSQEQRTKCEVWTRVMGYHRPVSQYNKGKKSEFYSRQYFLEQIEANKQFAEEY
jgi:hypothetical protein